MRRGQRQATKLAGRAPDSLQRGCSGLLEAYGFTGNSVPRDRVLNLAKRSPSGSDAVQQFPSEQQLVARLAGDLSVGELPKLSIDSVGGALPDKITALSFDDKGDKVTVGERRSSLLIRERVHRFLTPSETNPAERAGDAFRLPGKAHQGA